MTIDCCEERLVKNLDTQEYWVKMGPQHPSTHGVLRFLVKLDGETITDVIPHIGYMHRGIEKMGENVTYVQFNHLTSRLDYLSAMINNWGYCMCVEKALGVEVPARAEYVRIIMSELTRIASHQLWWGVYGMDLGAFTPMMHSFRDRETINDILEETCGSRLTTHYVRIGGLSNDVHENFVPRIKKFIDFFRHALTEYSTLVSGNIIFKKRAEGVGILKPEVGLSYGCSGSTLRGSGVNYDVRKQDPYGYYDRMKFEVPLGTRGDSLDRYECRFLEMEQSLCIIEQCIEQMEPGEVMAKVPKKIKLPAGEYFSHVESARGDHAYFIVSDGGVSPCRLRVRSPGYSNLSVLPEVVRGWRVADMVTVSSTLDLVAPDIDR